mmetsp:Transcript_22357/g.48928  ORF Transcript_22357/g.48928 Transcript_22357/m.48928 type:complete len:232 (-) Transcript_22357:62-757(-)|eukprot:CAMPEP_0206486936 /NCGR_PEP_ID=MMETSP0324_2-20121206/41317_1 /ASSEMBLY_ACC=CAM_ASM_000836 /TAXON_ID=2866 /ORGANISM="Crypthecodinium cohnii, Strain Seligo" /LENGTH=231 /DNA_ID=CAMNT_0053965271 /DNA_START=308 /DNA_END=1003 /DNA_ORIENTATION=-
MLAADKLLLTSTIRKSATELKGKELELHKTNFDAVGTQAAVLAGFAITGLCEFHVPEEANVFLTTGFYVFVVITLVANLRCVSMTTCITVMGTGLALRGPDGSMVKAVEGMYNARYTVFLTFGVGITSSLITACFICWLIMEPIPSIVCTLLLIWALISTARFTRRFSKLFTYNEEQTVSFDDILGSEAVNNEALLRQLGVDGNAEALIRLLRNSVPRRMGRSSHDIDDML